MLVLPKKTIHHVALTGFPRAGKSTLAKNLVDKGGYVHVSNDRVRADLFGKGLPFELKDHDWYTLFSEVQLRKSFNLIEGMDVATDSCPYNDGLRRMTMHVSPVVGEKLASGGIELARYMVVLDVNPEEILKRSNGAGRTSQRDKDYLRFLAENWEDASDFSDAAGKVYVLKYRNNEPGDYPVILSDLGKRLGVQLAF